MAVLTTTARLEAVQTAITAVLAGQSFTLDGVTFNRANLSTLVQYETMLENKLAKENGNRPLMKSIGFGGMSY